MSRVLLVVILGVLLLLPAAADAAGSSDVVISQIYGGGGNAGATFRNDYVELFNAGSATVDLAGWTVQYATAAGATWQATALAGTIAPGPLLPGPACIERRRRRRTSDAGRDRNEQPRRGEREDCARSRHGRAHVWGLGRELLGLVEDLVGYGDASDFEGSGSAAALSNTTAALRSDSGCTDTNDNAADFTAATPAPRNSASPAHLCAGTPSSGPSGSVNVDLNVASVLTVSLDHPSLSFGTFTSGDRPAPLPERVTVSSNNAAGYSLAVARTTFAPTDLPLALSATAPAGGTLGGGLSGGALVPIPVAPATALTVGTKSTASAAGGDVWATNIGFSAPLPLVATGRYSATVTFTAVAR